MKVYEEAKQRYIDMTPTFEEATAIALAVIEATQNEEAKAKAREELFRYARELDRLKAEVAPQGHEEELIILDDGFIWRVLPLTYWDVLSNGRPKQYQNSILFQLYDDGTEAMLEDDTELLKALRAGRKVALEVGFTKTKGETKWHG